MCLQKYHVVEKLSMMYTAMGLTKNAKKVEYFANDFEINKFTSFEPMTGKERKITVDKIFEKCLWNRRHTEAERASIEAMFEHHIIMRSKKRHMSYNVVFCENTPDTLIKLIYGWREFVYFVNDNDIIIDIYNDPNYFWHHAAKTQSVMMIHRKSKDEVYMEDEIIRVHDYKTGTVNRLSVLLQAVVTPEVNKIKLGNSIKNIYQPSLNRQFGYKRLPAFA